MLHSLELLRQIGDRLLLGLDQLKVRPPCITHVRIRMTGTYIVDIANRIWLDCIANRLCLGIWILIRILLRNCLIWPSRFLVTPSLGRPGAMSIYERRGEGMDI